MWLKYSVTHLFAPGLAQNEIVFCTLQAVQANPSPCPSPQSTPHYMQASRLDPVTRCAHLLVSDR